MIKENPLPKAWYLVTFSHTIIIERGYFIREVETAFLLQKRKWRRSLKVLKTS